MSVPLRIKQIRKNLGMSQKTFGENLGVSRDVINNIENGRVEATEATIKLVCATYKVDYWWLKDGAGEMYRSVDDDLMGKIDQLCDKNETAKALFKAFASLDEKEWEVLQKLIDRIKK